MSHQLGGTSAFVEKHQPVLADSTPGKSEGSHHVLQSAMFVVQHDCHVENSIKDLKNTMLQIGVSTSSSAKRQIPATDYSIFPRWEVSPLYERAPRSLRGAQELRGGASTPRPGRPRTRPSHVHLAQLLRPFRRMLTRARNLDSLQLGAWGCCSIIGVHYTY